MENTSPRIKRFDEAGILHPEAQGQQGQQFAKKKLSGTSDLYTFVKNKIVVRNHSLQQSFQEKQFAKKCKIFAWNHNLQNL